MVVYQIVKKSWRTYLVVSTQYTNVTDGWTDTRTTTLAALCVASRHKHGSRIRGR